MWWAMSPSPPMPGYILSPKLTKPLLRHPFLLVTASSQPHSRYSKLPQKDIFSAQQVGGLGHTLLTALNPNSNATNTIPEPQKQNQRRYRQEAGGVQINGSDVLWALQRATANKKKKQKRKGTSSVVSHGEENGVDYSNVRPLCIKSDWGPKLDDFEKRLQEISEII
ncbi:Death domain associated protein [Quillaja saponaria]|uniref:Death domain associated protein n=1 Tax=Quillaja saponaria TaxID=32244 RepID=A0AAD7LSD0_QUISA|nr:Death domain associated protein [Quillaja saponaria]